MVAVPCPCHGTTGTVPSGATRYSFLGCIITSRSSLEVVRFVYWQHSSTLSRYGVRVTTNATTSASTGRVRVNFIDGNGTFSIPAGTTGYFEDTTNSDAVVAGDAVGDKIVNGGGGSLVALVSQILNEADSGTAVVYGSLPTGGTLIAPSTTYVFPAVGDGIPSVVAGETAYQLVCTINGELKNSLVVVNSNSRSDATDFRSGINGADGNLLASIPAATTGAFEDLTNSDVLTDGDRWNPRVTTGPGTGSISILYTKHEIHSTDESAQLYTYSNNATSINAGATKYWALGGAGSNTTTESSVKTKAGTAMETGRLQVNITANSLTGNCTARLRVNGANVNQVITIAASTTGTFEDAINTDSVVDTDDLNYSAAAAAGGVSISVRWWGLKKIGVEVPPVVPPVVTPPSGAGGGRRPRRSYVPIPLPRGRKRKKKRSRSRERRKAIQEAITEVTLPPPLPTHPLVGKRFLSHPEEPIEVPGPPKEEELLIPLSVFEQLFPELLPSPMPIFLPPPRGLVEEEFVKIERSQLDDDEELIVQLYLEGAFDSFLKGGLKVQ